MADLQPDVLGSAMPRDEIIITPPDWKHPETSGPTTMQQLLDDATARGRENLVGAAFVLDNEMHVISGYTEIGKPVVHYKRTKLPRFRAGGSGKTWAPTFARELVVNDSPKEGDQTFAIGGGTTVWDGRHRPRTLSSGGPQLERRLVRSLDIYDEAGYLVRTMQLDQDQLRDYINYGSTDDKPRRQIKKIFWLPEVSDIIPDRTIPIRLNRSGDVYDQIRTSQDVLMLPNWQGLVLELPTETSVKLRVIKDSVTSRGLSDRYTEHHRAVVVNYEDESGVATNQRVFDEKGFRTFLEENRNDPRGAPRRPFSARWEVPKEIISHRPREAADLLGQWALGLNADIGYRTVGNTPDELLEMVRDPSVDGGIISRFGSKLNELISPGGIGVQVLRDTAQAIRNEYILDKDRLGLPHVSDGPSTEAIMWELVKACYFFDYPHEAAADTEQAGTFQADPFEHSLPGRQRQREIVDRLIGAEIAGKVLKPDVRPYPTGRVHPRTKQIIIDEKYFIDVKREALGRLQSDARHRVGQALGHIYAKLMDNSTKAPEDRAPVTWSELAQVGREARRSLNQ